MKKIILNAFVTINFLLLFSATPIVMAEEHDVAKKLNCTNYVQSMYKKGWDKVCVRLGDNPGLLLDATKKQLDTTKFFKKSFPHVLKNNTNEFIKLSSSHKISLNEQYVELVVNYDKNGKDSEILIAINQINTIESAFEHFIDTGQKFAMRNRPSFLAFPDEKFFTETIQQQYNTNVEVKNLKNIFSTDLLDQLAYNSDYFFAHNDWIPNLILLYKNNISVLIQDISSTTDIDNREYLNNTRPNLREILSMTDITGCLFKEIPDKNITIKDVPQEQLVLYVVENKIRESGKCVVSWKLTSDAKLPLYGAWVRCDVDKGKGMIEINEPMSNTAPKNMNENTTKLNRPTDEGKITISKIPSNGCTLTTYAITSDGKTWYKRQIKIDPKKLLPPINYPYRHWWSSNGQYRVMARLISINGIEDFVADEINLDKLKNMIVTIERQDNKVIIDVKFKDLSKNDQEYLLEQLKNPK